MTIRTHRRERYTTIDNNLINDKSLSWDARGLIIYLLSKPDGWIVQMGDLINQSPKAGRDKVRRILGELADRGYLFRYQTQGEGGKLEWVSEIFETPEECQEWLRSFDYSKAIRLKTIDGFSVNGEDSTIDGFSIDGSTIDGSTIDGLPIDGQPALLINTDIAITDLKITDLEITESVAHKKNSKILETPIVEESIEGELLSSEIELHQSVPVQNSRSRSDRSGASAARNPARGALEQAFECKSSSDPNFARFRRAYQGVLAIGDGNSSFGNMRDAQIAWQGLVDEGAIDDLFWRGVDAYLVQQGQLRMRGEKNYPPGAAKFLETRAWETALLRSEQQTAAKGAGLPDVGATAAERKNAEFKANMAEAMKIIQERYAC